MKHLPILSKSFSTQEVGNSDMFQWMDSNYVPVYTIGFPEYLSNYFTSTDKIDLNSYYNNFIGNRLLNYYAQDLPNKISKKLLKNFILNKRISFTNLLKEETDAWLNTPVNFNNKVIDKWRKLFVWGFKEDFFKRNYFSKNRDIITNYGFYGTILNNKYIPKIVLMVKKSDINTVKKCFILNQPFPDGLFELWISPDLSKDDMKYYGALKNYISENKWKVVKYDMKGILAGIETPKFRSIKHKNQWEEESWKEFCNSELALLVEEEELAF